jgi:hypothetical protein
VCRSSIVVPVNPTVTPVSRIPWRRLDAFWTAGEHGSVPEDWHAGPLGIANILVQIASHIPRDGLLPVRLYGGPWDCKDVFVPDPYAAFLRVHGPRNGRHSVWITHLYERRDHHWEFVSTEETALSAWRITLGDAEKRG